MPRKPVSSAPGVPVYIVQRGHLQGACFFTDQDYQSYFDGLTQGLARYFVRLHAFCLLPNQLHFLLTPGDRDGVANLLEHTAQRYMLHVQRQYRRSGNLWQSNYTMCRVVDEDYILLCYRYIDAQPVNTGLVAMPGSYRWCSYACHAQGSGCDAITHHERYGVLGVDSKQQQSAYRELFATPLPIHVLGEIRASLTFGYPLGEKYLDK